MENTEGKIPERKIYCGYWKCGVCGKGIDSLPFEPNAARLRALRCWDCHQKIEMEPEAQVS